MKDHAPLAATAATSLREAIQPRRFGAAFFMVDLCLGWNGGFMLIVDRITEGIVLCESSDKSLVSLPLSSLPQGLREGDCLRLQQDGSYRIDREETRRRRAANAALFRSLLNPDAD